MRFIYYFLWLIPLVSYASPSNDILTFFDGVPSGQVPNSVAFCPHSQTAAMVAGSQIWMYAYNSSSNKFENVGKTNTLAGAFSIAFSPNTKFIAVSSSQTALYQYNRSTGNLTYWQTVNGSSAGYSMTPFSPDSSSIVLSDEAGNLYVYKITPSGLNLIQTINPILPSSNQMWGFEFSPDGTLAAASYTND